MPIVELASLVEAGFLGRALGLLAVASQSRTLTLSEHVLQLELIDATSSSDSAHERALKLLADGQVSADDRVRCLIVAGTSLMRHGQDDAGNSQFRRAQSIAVKCSNQIAAHAQVAYLAALASWVGPEAASLEVAKSRKQVVSAGVPNLMIRFHLAVAKIAAKRGYLQRARHHLRCREQPLGQLPERVFESRTSTNSERGVYPWIRHRWRHRVRAPCD